jgi:hypothetical protein
VERVTQRRPTVVRVLRGAPDREETAALTAALLTALGTAAARDREAGEVPGPGRPTWRAFAGHSGGGWGRP